jgi:hypothetical protein
MDTKRVIRRVLAALAVPAAASAVLASTAGAASAATASAANPPPPSVYSTDTGWVTNYNGNCAVEAHVDYYPGSDTAYIPRNWSWTHPLPELRDARQRAPSRAAGGRRPVAPAILTAARKRQR